MKYFRFPQTQCNWYILNFVFLRPSLIRIGSQGIICFPSLLCQKFSVQVQNSNCYSLSSIVEEENHPPPVQFTIDDAIMKLGSGPLCTESHPVYEPSVPKLMKIRPKILNFMAKGEDFRDLWQNFTNALPYYNAEKLNKRVIFNIEV